MARRVVTVPQTLLRLVLAVIVLGGVLMLVAWLPSGCTPMVNRFAFYPHTGTPIDGLLLPPGVGRVTFGTSDGETIEGYLIPATTHPERLVLSFHGNAGNVAERLPELREMAARTGASVLGSGYRGYGASTGSPNEQGIYRDGEAALAFCRDTLGYQPGQIVVVGRSLGSTVATHLAAQGEDFAGVVLITPLSTGRDFGRAHMGAISVMAGRSFDNLRRAPSITEPALVIHGLNDTVIPYENGKKLFDALAGPKRMVTLIDAGHNDLELIDSRTYWEAFASFVASRGTPLHARTERTAAM